jgi:hypothetical protein
MSLEAVSSILRKRGDDTVSQWVMVQEQTNENVGCLETESAARRN